MLKIGEVAEKCGVSTGTIRDWVKKGYIKCDRTPGGMRIFREEEVEALLSRMVGVSTKGVV